MNTYNLNRYLNVLDKACEELNIPKNQVIISHGGATFIWGIWSETNDIDVSIPENIFSSVVVEKEIIHRPALNQETAVRSWIYENEIGEVDYHCHKEDTNDKELVEYAGFMVTSIKQTQIDYLKLNRDKDQAAIKALGKML